MASLAQRVGEELKTIKTSVYTKNEMDAILADFTPSGGAGAVTGTSTAPILSGLNVANETQSIVITVDNYDPSSIYAFDVSGGSFSRTLGTITWLLPMVTESASHKLTVTVTNPGKTPTQVFHNVNVFNIDTVIDSMVVYENASMVEMLNRNNISIVSNKLVATADTTLTISNNKIISIPTMEVGDKILVDDITYEITGIQAVVDGSLNSSNTDITPVLTSNTSALATVGEAIYNTQYPEADNYGAWRAFNSNLTDGWMGGVNQTSDLWIGFKFNTPKIVNKYKIVGNIISAATALKSWKFQASNDGLTWTDLSEETNQINWGVSESRTFYCINGSKYNRYRVYITSNNGNTNYAGLSNLELIEVLPVVSSTQPILPQFITSAKLLTKYAESNVITQDSYETDFTGVNNLEVIYEQYNLVSPSTTLTSVPTTFLNIGDIAVIGNTVDGEKSITVTTENYVNGNLNISSLGFTVVPTYGYRKDAKLQVTIGDLALEASGRVDTVLTSPLFATHGDYNPSTTSKVPVLTADNGNVLFTGSQWGGSETWHIFDGTDVGCTYNSTSPASGYKFNSPIIVNKYGIRAITNSWAGPRDWVFEGSNNGSTWVPLQTISGVTWPSSNTTRWYTFDNATPYQYYRVRRTDTLNWPTITELYLVEWVLPKMTIKAKYSNIITGNSARTMKFRVKLNRIDDAVSKVSGTLQKL